eukprot:403352776
MRVTSTMSTTAGQGGTNYAQLLIQAQEQKNLATRLINLQPSIDNREPKKFQHLNQKKGFNEMSRQKQIDNENSKLLKKMLDIIQRKNQSFRQGDASTSLQGQQIQSDRKTVSSGVQSSDLNSNLGIYTNLNLSQNNISGSLNFYQRKKELEQINQSNKLMLKHLSQVKPSIKKMDWQDHIKRYQQLKQHLSINKSRHKSPSNQNNQSVLLPILNNSRSTKTSNGLNRSFLMSQQSQRYHIKASEQLNQSQNTVGISANLQTDISMLISSQQDYASARGDTRGAPDSENQTTSQSTAILQGVPVTMYNQKFMGVQKPAFINKSQQNMQPMIRRVNRIKVNPYFDQTNEDQTSRMNTSQTQLEPNEVFDDKRQQMTKSVPKPRGYFENIIKSPLLNFANYPQSIVKRISSRGQAHREKIIKKGQQNNNQLLQIQDTSNLSGLQKNLHESAYNQNSQSNNLNYTANEQSSSSLMMKEIEKNQNNLILQNQKSNQDLQSIYNSVHIKSSRTKLNIQDIQEQLQANQSEPKTIFNVAEQQTTFQDIVKQDSSQAQLNLLQQTVEEKTIQNNKQEVHSIVQEDYKIVENNDKNIVTPQQNSTIEEQILFSNQSAMNTTQL